MPKFPVDAPNRRVVRALVQASKSLRGNADCRIMERSVPMRSSLWSGTGSVVVSASSRFCITMWLPFRRTSANPCCPSIRHTSAPDMRFNSGNAAFHWDDVALARRPALNLFFACAFEEKLDGFFEHGAGLFDGAALAGNIQFRAKRHEPVVFSFNQCGEMSCSHIGILSRRLWTQRYKHEA